MFFYYGSKHQLAAQYPEPEFETIIEPFAGSAAYSLHGDRWEREVILVEKNRQVVDIWKWLVETATVESIEALPPLTAGEQSSEFLHIVHAATQQALRDGTVTITPQLADDWEISRRYLAGNLHKIRHWQIRHGNYNSAPNVTATWFVDPPYEGETGTGYEHGSESLAYDALASWILARRGQVIACESGNADYLPFEPMPQEVDVADKAHQEAVYVRSGTVTS